MYKIFLEFIVKTFAIGTGILIFLGFYVSLYNIYREIELIIIKRKSNGK